jgi:hypothetical protein
VQLALIAAALRGVFAAPATSIVVVAVMFTVATGTASRRLRDLPGAPVAVVLSCGAGAAVTIGIIVGLPILSRDVRTLVAVSGVVIGGAMTAATLTGRQLSNGTHCRRDEIEAWLSIGATHAKRYATSPLCRRRSARPRPGHHPHRRTGHPARRVRRGPARRGQCRQRQPLPNHRPHRTARRRNPHRHDSRLAPRRTRHNSCAASTLTAGKSASTVHRRGPTI